MEQRFEIVERSAGFGGYGRIDKATDLDLLRPVAIKTLDPLFKTTLLPDDIERFRREGRALAQLTHPSIPAIYDVQFRPDDSEFRIIFEWIEGRTLRDHLQDRGVLSLEEARGIFAQICSALGHAHEKNIIHRDVKPSNIILADDLSTAYLVDFGIALHQDDLSRITSGTPIGSTGYMSPEQERGDDLGFTADVFALGVVLYEALAGSRPSVAGYRSLTLHNESIPPSVDELVKQSLHEDPLRRPQTPRHFIQQLTESLRPHANFAATLADGSLHEIQIALSSMKPDDYGAIPPGQRMLVRARVDDLAAVDEDRLRRAVAALLRELTRLGYFGDVARYDEILTLAFDYGYEKSYGDTWQGDGSVRASLSQAGLTSSAAIHEMFVPLTIERASSAGVAKAGGWYAHDLRVLLQNLLINPACSGDSAIALGESLRQLNLATH